MEKIGIFSSLQQVLISLIYLSHVLFLDSFIENINFNLRLSEGFGIKRLIMVGLLIDMLLEWELEMLLDFSDCLLDFVYAECFVLGFDEGFKSEGKFHWLVMGIWRKDKEIKEN